MAMLPAVDRGCLFDGLGLLARGTAGQQQDARCAGPDGRPEPAKQTRVAGGLVSHGDSLNSCCAYLSLPVDC
jgi:hypothetical protein